MATRSDQITAPPPRGVQEAPGQPLPMSQPILPDETLAVPEVGLGRMPQPGKRVIVLGGGIAGLVAAFELKRQGHEPLVLEAQGRVGGRVRTIRDFAPGLHAEAGAMRIPRVHDLTLAYCELFGLELRPFVTNNPKGLVHLDGARMTVAEADAHPERLPFALSETEQGKTWTELWDEATSEFRERYASGGDEAVEELLREYDRYSIGEFLATRGFSEGAIELYGVMSFRESDIEGRVTDQLREAIGGSSGNMHEIVGGFDQLPNAFYDYLRPNVRFGAQVTAIGQSPDDVTVHYRTPAGRFTVHGDYAICALPFSVLREIEVLGSPFSRQKQKAIRELNYNASTKILFGVRHRFWEREDGIVGGTTVTDLPIRRMVYPSFSDPEDERGTLLASYTWGGDALRWGAMDTAVDDRGGAGGGGADPPVGGGRVRGGGRPRLVLRSVRSRRLRPVRAAGAGAAAGVDRRAGGADSFRGRAHVAIPRLDPGSAGVGDPCRNGGARSAGGVRRAPGRLKLECQTRPLRPAPDLPDNLCSSDTDTRRTTNDQRATRPAAHRAGGA